MRCIHIKNTDPFFCLAAEEYLLKIFDDDIFMLWQSEDTVVVGKHQNALGEINYPFVRENNIKIARRISGGGTVFHDAGNVNFSFIKNVKSPSEISFKHFTAPVVEALAKLDISATTSGRNDLMINGLKISGNAEHVYKNRVLHHGTLLFNSDLNNLGQAIKVIPGKYTSKAVQSKRSPVVNISQFLKTEMSVGEFIQFLLDVQLKKSGNTIYELNETDIQTIDKLSTEKFKTWEWNFGYSPKYSFKNEVEIGGKILQIEMVVQKGVIEECAISGGCFTEVETEKISSGLLNKRHFFEEVSGVFHHLSIEEKNKMLYLLF